MAPPDAAEAPGDRRRVLAQLRRHGPDAISFLALESGMRHWFDAPPPEGTGACVAYVDTGSAWVAAGGPLAAAPDAPRAAERFVAAARRAGRRASFFGAERRLPGLRALCLGEQPIFSPAEWLRAGGAPSRGVREQIRRARNRGVRVRRVEARELRPGAPLRAEIEALSREWLASRSLEPMGFLVAVEPFHLPEEHRYFLAERGGRPVAFLSAVPAYGGSAWLVEDLLRRRGAPSGTAEALVAALMREVASADLVTLGLAPLSGEVAPWQRAARWLSRPLYDFAGLRAFKERLHPGRWEPVWLAFPRGGIGLLHVVDALRAFAAGPLWRFGARSLLRHPAGPPWAVALLLGAWTPLLAVLFLLDRGGVLGFPRATLGGWVAFDALLAMLLFRLARRPRPAGLVLAALLAAGDAALSLVHLAGARPPEAGWHLALRALAAGGPVAGVLALGWAAVLRVRRGGAALPVGREERGEGPRHGPGLLEHDHVPRALDGLQARRG